MASLRDTLAGLFAKESPSAIQGTPLGNAYPGLAQPEQPLEAPMFAPDDLIGMGFGKAAVTGGAKLGKAYANALGTALKHQVETGTGIIGKNVLNPRTSIVPTDVVKSFDMPTTLPNAPEFAEAVANTPHASITPEGLKINLSRFQKPEQELEESVRTGVFYLPEGSAQVKYYKGKGTTGGAYGGSQAISGETLYKNPLLAKGGTGGKAPEEAYRQLVPAETYYGMKTDLAKTIKAKDKGSEAYMFLEKYAPEIADNAWNIARNSTQGNQFRYALQEAVIANEARKAGHDAILGYSKGRSGRGHFLSEVFDTRESHYPSPSGEYGLHPEFEDLIKNQQLSELLKNK